MGGGHSALTSMTIEMNFDSLKLTRLLSGGIQSVWSFRHHLRCIVTENKVHLRSNRKHERIKKKAFGRLVRVEWEPDVRTLQATGIRGCPPLTLSALHT